MELGYMAQRLWESSLFGCLCLAFVIAGCTSDTPTQVVVTIDAESVSKVRATSLWIGVCNQDGESLRDTNLSPEFPRELSLAPRDGDASRQFAVVVELSESGGTTFNRQRLISTYTPNQRISIPIVLDDACIDRLDCGGDETCNGGACVSARRSVNDSVASFGPCTGGGDGDADADADAESDADADADNPDALTAPDRLRPWNGETTGSVHAPASGLTSLPRRPRFSWRSVDGATYYDLQLTRSCDLSELPDCSFVTVDESYRVDLSAESERAGDRFIDFTPTEDLAVTETPPVGERYFWRVRSCGDGVECSAWSSPVRYIDVARVENDFNGDGYSDLLVGEPNFNESEGRAYVYYGSGDGLVSGPTLQNPLLQGQSWFGVAVATAGDVDADGFCDAIVGANSMNNPEEDEGSAYLYFGDIDGLSDSRRLELDNPADFASGLFGDGARSAGDFDGDGYGDVIVGERDWAEALDVHGAVHLYRGRDLAVEIVSAPITLVHPTDDGRPWFGNTTAAADLNGDGYNDIVVGAWDEDYDVYADAGWVYVYLGNAGLSFGEQIGIRNPHPNPTDGNFGYSLSEAGDANGDGLADLLVGSLRNDRSSSIDVGAGYLYLGRETGIAPSPSVTLYATTRGSDLRAGASVALAGDIDGDGFQDFIVGASHVGDADFGEAYLYRGSADGPLADEGDIVTLDSPTTQADAWFGAAVAGIGDIDGDGLADFAVAAPSYSSLQAAVIGQVYIYRGSDGVISTEPIDTLLEPDGTPDTTFGHCLSSIRY